MSAKPILYFAMVRPQYGYAFRIIGVTSEKHRQIYGRDEAGEGSPTHVPLREVIYKFPEGTTAQHAAKASDRAMIAHGKFEAPIKAARSMLEGLLMERAQATEDAAKGLEPQYQETAEPPPHVPGRTIPDSGCPVRFCTARAASAFKGCRYSLAETVPLDCARRNQ